MIPVRDEMYFMSDRMERELERKYGPPGGPPCWWPTFVILGLMALLLSLDKCGVS